MSPLAESLPKDLAAEHAMILAERAARDAERAARLAAEAAVAKAHTDRIALDLELERLRFQLAKARHAAFGQSSEARIGQFELALVDVKETLAAMESADAMATPCQVDGNHFFLSDAFTADVKRAICEAQETARNRGPALAALASTSSTDYACAIEIAASPSAVCGETLTVEVTITNLSPVTWDTYSRSGIAVANHWLDVDGGIIVWFDASAGLREALAPGQKCVMSLDVTVPQKSGHYVLEVDLVEQGVAWFEEQGEDTGSIATTLIEARAAEPVVWRSAFRRWTDASLR